ncbi:GNAT family N-acetyltransferase [Actinopolymorpha rutila]|uniref:RimJ/RimL family protein N-acetyltransferase n=1 Tax=Actinopolymorpha rutila TaxID=446787 RepID=A0A852ZLC4_9ACTN|nr:RimJ/RimL family protein N-acetyltransferase [Actinopolymorpha rutila]
MTDEAPASIFSAKPTLIGKLVTLRPFLAEDTPVLRSMLRDAEIGRLTGSVHATGEVTPWDETAEARMLAWYSSRNAQPDRLDLAVVDRRDDACVGEVVLNEWDEPNRSCNIRIALVSAGQGRGLGTEAMRLMVAHGFEQLGLHRISLNVYDFNPRARRAYEKVGFVQEGARRDVLCLDGEWVSDVVMSILAPEWRNRSAD